MAPSCRASNISRSFRVNWRGNSSQYNMNNYGFDPFFLLNLVWKRTDHLLVLIFTHGWVEWVIWLYRIYHFRPPAWRIVIMPSESTAFTFPKHHPHHGYFTTCTARHNPSDRPCPCYLFLISSARASAVRYMFPDIIFFEVYSFNTKLISKNWYGTTYHALLLL